MSDVEAQVELPEIEIFTTEVEGALDFLAEPTLALDTPSPARSSFSARPTNPLEASLVGDGRAIQVFEILGLLSSLSKSGLLWVTTARERFLVQIEKGKIVYAQSDRPPAGWRLGEMLVARKAIDPEVLAESIAGAHRTNVTLGAWLLASNRVAPKDLHGALRDQVQNVFNRMFAANDATYQYEDGKRVGRPDDVRMNVVQVLLESARVRDEQIEMPVPIGPATVASA